MLNCVKPRRRTAVLALATVACASATAVMVQASGASGAAPTETLWPSSAVPALSAEADAQPVELGVKFRSDVAGQVLGVRFFKGLSNTGKHVGNVWTIGGRRLASVTFSGETASGWQQARFSSPVSVKAGETYVASYHTKVGRYAADNDYFDRGPRDSGNLHAPASTATSGNGVYRYGSSGFPAHSWRASNYWVDVVFRAATTPTPTATPTPTPTATATPTATPTPTPTPTATSTPGRFSFDAAGRILDPNGKRFIPVGLNANGPDWVWPGATIGQSTAMAQWGFNTLRINTCFPGGCTGQPDWTTNNDLDGIITEYTSKHYVILIGQMQYGASDTISDAHVAELADWWKTTAAKYKNNPYVWFNLINEPTGTNLPAWYSITTRLADAVRSVASDSVLVVDGNSSGQDKGGWGCDGNDWPTASAALNYGPEFRQRYGAVVFSSHLYGQWGGNQEYGCGTSQWQANLNAYLDALQAKGVPLIAGEFGSEVDKANETWWMGGSWNATHAVLDVLPARGIGMLFWHGDDGAGGMDLLSPSGSWTSWLGDVGRLTWEGQGLHNFAQQVSATAG